MEGTPVTEASPSTLLRTSLVAFMSKIIDYAGLFPPAQLPLAQAIENYARYRQEDEQWMLSRFIIPVARLADLSAIAGHHFRADDPFAFSVLGRAGTLLSSDEFGGNLAADLAAIAAFRHRHTSPEGGGVIVDAFEARLPDPLTARPGPAGLDDLLVSAGELLAAAGRLRPFYESSPGSDWNGSIGGAIEAIARYNEAALPSGLPAAGFKLRCGGDPYASSPAAFPTPAQVAFALVACRDAGVAMKATAGLHHPVRRFDASVKTKTHGFFNVFGAGILAHRHSLSAVDVLTIIADEDSTHFVFTDDVFAWQDLRAATAEVHRLRQETLLSFGSCSFDEPREDLRAMGML